MRARRSTPSVWLGMLDLVFLLCMLFFLTTVISVRRMAMAEDVAEDRPDGEERPVVLRLSAPGEPEAAVDLVSTGGRVGPGSVPLIRWLAAACRLRPTPVEIACPPEATHRACKRGVLDLRSAARACEYRY